MTNARGSNGGFSYAPTIGGSYGNMGYLGVLLGAIGGILLGLGDSLVIYVFARWLVERRPSRAQAFLLGILGMRLLFLFLILSLALKVAGFWPFVILACTFSLVRLITLFLLGRRYGRGDEQEE